MAKDLAGVVCLGMMLCSLAFIGPCPQNSETTGDRNLSIHEAAWRGELEVVKQICESSPEAASARDKFGRTPLHEAAVTNQYAVVKYLLSRGASLNDCDGIGYTPLHEAVRRARLEIVRALLEAGADVNKSCCQTVGSEDEKYQWCGPTPLELAAERGHLEVARLLLAAGASVGICPDGKTPLYHACRGQLAPEYDNEKQARITKMVELLMAHGAKIDERDQRGRTPLHWAAVDIYEGPEATRNLINFGADVNARDSEGCTPLHLLAEFAGILRHPSQVMIARILVMHGADVKAQNKDGETPLDLAGKHKNSEWLATLLLEYQ